MLMSILMNCYRSFPLGARLPHEQVTGHPDVFAAD